MKRITLLFLALSSLTLAAASTDIGDNDPFQTTSNSDTAGININVSAIVTTSDTTQLTIVDETGTQISDVNFYHILTQDVDNVLGGEKELTQSIYAQAPGLTDTTKGKITNNNLNDFTSGNFTSTVNTVQGSFDSSIKGVKYTLTSTASATGSIPKDQVISTTPQVLIFTYDKTK
ncbi:hypothetical protein [Cetobacterium sp.]|uniref:hypothetical protein n=1 Tax=Cetobacterium sp. TaxID=2071632 RepID=UPI003EE54435